MRRLKQVAAERAASGCDANVERLRGHGDELKEGLATSVQGF